MGGRGVVGGGSGGGFADGVGYGGGGPVGGGVGGDGTGGSDVTVAGGGVLQCRSPSGCMYKQPTGSP